MFCKPSIFKHFDNISYKAIILFSLLLSIFLFHKYDHRFIYGSGVKEDILNKHAVNYILKHKLNDDIFNDYSSGSFLIFGLYPDYKVFIDPRTTLYTGTFYKEYIDFIRKPSISKWIYYEKHFNIHTVVINSDLVGLYNTITFSSPDWNTVYWDNKIIILSNTPATRSIKYVKPFDINILVSAWNKYDLMKKKVILGELHYIYSLNESNYSVIKALSYIYFLNNDFSNSYHWTEKGLNIYHESNYFKTLKTAIILKDNNVVK